MIKTLKSEIVYENKWIEVNKNKILINDIEGEYGVVKHKNESVVVLVEKNNEILIVKAYRYTLDEYTFELPAGMIEEDESPIDAAKREVYEETGIEINDEKLLLTYNPSNGTSNQVIHIVKAKYKSGEINPDKCEVDFAMWKCKNEFIKEIKNSKISDGPSIIAVLLDIV